MSFSLVAKASCPELQSLLRPVFEEHFGNDHTYTPYRCETNAFALAQNFLSFERSEVVVIWSFKEIPSTILRGKKENWLPIVPLKARQKEALWAYHVFVMIDGMVLDLDFGDQPKIVSLAEYLRQMYLDTTDLGNYWLASWPAQDYTTSLVQRYGPTQPSEPLLNIEDFLEEKMVSTQCAF